MRHWRSRGVLAWLLWPVSLAFGLVVLLRRLLFRLRVVASHDAGVPVIVVGNLTAGGSGKTPLVLWIAGLLREHHWKPGIVSRGYLGGARTAGGEAQAPREATIASDPAQVGDEPILLARRSGCPVWVAPDRVAACRALRSQHPDCDVIITDDGLQHYALRRDIEICVVDGRGEGNGFLQPAGPLREPRSRLRTVDAVVVHGAASAHPGARAHAMALEGDKLVRMTDAGDVRAAKSFAGQRMHAVAGIGDPRRFFLQLARFGIKVVPHPFPDHHPFGAGDFAFGDNDPVVMTEKDAVKCRGIAQANPQAQYWVFPVSAALDPAFGRWLLERLSGSKAA